MLSEFSGKKNEKMAPFIACKAGRQRVGVYEGS